MQVDRPGPGEEPNTSGTVAEPRQAATVIVLRGGDRALEVLLVQRTPAARFMGGVWVFPGGAVDSAEGEGDTAHRVAAYAVGPARTLEEHERRCRDTGYWWASGQRIELSIRDAHSGAFAGHLQMTQVEPEAGQAMIGYSLLPEFTGRGFMTRAVGLLARWAFANTPLHRIAAETDVINTASQAVLERAGFRREGPRRAPSPKADGTRGDDVQWELLRPAS